MLCLKVIVDGHTYRHTDQLTISELPEESIDNDNVASNIEENVMVLDNVSFYDAKCNELQNWKDNEVFDEINDDIWTKMCIHKKDMYFEGNQGRYYTQS